MSGEAFWLGEQDRGRSMHIFEQVGQAAAKLELAVPLLAWPQALMAGKPAADEAFRTDDLLDVLEFHSQNAYLIS